MKVLSITRILPLVALMVLAQGVLGAAETVLAPAKRLDTISQAKSLLAEKATAFSGKNPFNPEGVKIEGTGPVVTTQPDAPRNLIQVIGESLKPSGYFVINGEPTLVFGQKRVKAGGLLTITFEGSEYTVEIVSIDRPNFTLRLNREEFTRPIK